MNYRNIESWSKSIENLMIKTGLAKEEFNICRDSFKTYYEEGVSPYEVLREEFGDDWVKLYQQWYYNNYS